MPSPMKTTPQGLTLGGDGGASSDGTDQRCYTDGSQTKPDYRQMCKYGVNCYQKNPMHHQKFKHPSKEAEKPETEEVEQEAKDEPKPEDLKEEEPKTEEEDAEADSKEEPKVEEVPKEKEDEDEKGEEGDAEAVEPPPAKRARTEPEEPRTDGKSLSVAELAGLSAKDRIRLAYGGMEMPPDFFEFWKFAVNVNRANPLEAFVPTLGLRLVGPFELMADDSWILKKETVLQNDLMCHHRYFYDPPEVQTVVVSTDPDSTFHLGYFRDCPKELPAFISASGGTTKEEKVTDGFSNRARIQMVGDNLFGAVFNLIKKIMLEADPFKQTAINKLKESLHVTACQPQEHDFSLEAKTPKMKARDKIKVTQTFHGAGLIVPYNKETQVGYREIPESTASLKKIFRNVVQAETQDKADSALDVLQELITNVQFANDEGDPGMGLELGLNGLLMAPGDVEGGSGRLVSSIRHLTTVAYDLLDRDVFAEVVKAHLIRRQADKDKFVME